jgi:DNA-binding transcriptional ArsR family regulator
MNEIIFSALAEPNRLNIVELLREGPLFVGEISARLELNQPQTSKHLRILCDAGLVEMHASANRRIYSLRPQPLIDLDIWLESFRIIGEKKFDRMDEYLRDLQGKEKKD